MNLEERIINKVKLKLDPIFFEIENESSKHAHGGSESHFRLLVVSDKFLNQNRVERQKFIYDLLKEEMSEGIHALAQRMLTPEEWGKLSKIENSSTFKSPNCHGKK